jgi:hypothetical protein
VLEYFIASELMLVAALTEFTSAIVNRSSIIAAETSVINTEL